MSSPWTTAYRIVPNSRVRARPGVGMPGEEGRRQEDRRDRRHGLQDVDDDVGERRTRLEAEMRRVPADVGDREEDEDRGCPRPGHDVGQMRPAGLLDGCVVLIAHQGRVAARSAASNPVVAGQPDRRRRKAREPLPRRRQRRLVHGTDDRPRAADAVEVAG